MVNQLSRIRQLTAVGAASPYRPVLTHPVLRRVLPGIALSSLGDGMAVVAVSWLALQLAPRSGQSLWVAAATAAYTLPGALGAVVLRRLLSGVPGLRLAGQDAALRMLTLAAIATLGMSGALPVGVYVALLGASSVLHSWGWAGRYSLIAEFLPSRHHVPGNAVLAMLGALGTVAGPALAGVLIAQSGPVTVVAIDATTFAVLAASCALASAHTRHDSTPNPEPSDDRPDAARSDFAHPDIRGVLWLSAGFVLLFGTVYVALPVHVASGLGASAGTLSIYYSVFGAGSVLGGLITRYLGRGALWPTIIGIVIVFGVVMLPLGLAVPIPLALAGFGVAGMLWPAYAALTTGLLQHSTPHARLTRVLAVNSAIRVTAVPLGTGLGGPLVAWLGASHTLLLTAVAITGLGLSVGMYRATRDTIGRSGGSPE